MATEDGGTWPVQWVAAIDGSWRRPLCNDTQFPDEYNNCSKPESLPTLPIVLYVHGMISPAVILFTIVTNTLVSAVLLRPSMRSATNLILLAMAQSDMLTGLWPLPCYIYFYTLERAAEYLPYSWCFVYHCLYEYLPIICHTASVWLTVGLAVHRYICVCHSMLAKKLCTIKNVVRGIVAIYVIAILSQVTMFFDKFFDGVVVPSRLGGPNVTVVGCVRKYASFVTYSMDLYFNVYYWFRVVFINIVPCFILIVMNAMLIRTMRQAQRRRRQLLAQNRKSECRRLAERNMTTMMLVVVVGVFLLAELPNAVFMFILIVDNTWDLRSFFLCHTAQKDRSHYLSSTTPGTFDPFSCAARSRRTYRIIYHRQHLGPSIPFSVPHGPEGQIASSLIDNTWGVEILTEETTFIAPLLLNLFILLSYPLNFFIYCTMSRQFRDAFRELCCLCCGGPTAPPASDTTTYVTVAMNDMTKDRGGGSGRQSNMLEPSTV